MADSIVPAAQSQLLTSLRAFADQLANLPDEDVPLAFEAMDQGKALFDEGRERFRQKLLDKLQQSGERVGDKGSLAMEIGTRRVAAIRTKTGYDPKLVEAMLRRRGLAVEAWMLPTIAYKVSDEKLATGLQEGKFTAADLEGCRYSETFRLEVKHANRQD
jgi:hypothetical protein